MTPRYEVNAGGCFICVSHYRDRLGYPRAYCPARKHSRPLSCILFEKHHGVSILRGFVVRHECDEPMCINVAHMLIGTRKDNAEDMVRRGRASNRTGQWMKVSDAEVREIRASSETLWELSKRYGITMAHAHNIRSGKSRKQKQPGFAVHEPAAA